MTTNILKLRRAAGVLLLLWLLPSLAGAQRFAAIGDYGSAGAPEQEVAALVKSWQPEFIITLGDNNYDQGEASTIDANIGQYYHEYIGPYQGKYGPGAAANRFFPSLGNHDLYTQAGRAYLEYFSLPGNERYYDFVRGNVHFFVLNSNPSEPDGIGADSRQAQWLQQRLAASTAPWKVVYLHHPPYSSGEHGSTAALRWPFCLWGASLVLAGHDHHYERLQERGLPYVVNGLGGKSIYSIGKGISGSQVRYGADYGALFLQASPDSLHFEFRTRANQLIDAYTLRKASISSPAGLTGQNLLVLPNPVSGPVAVIVTVPVTGPATLRVLDMVGREVKVLFRGELAAGQHQLAWPRGTLAPGQYFLELTTACTTHTVRAVAL